jgi:hypothetical protein
MDWTAPIDLYCERTGPEFWAEPLNAVSNAAFLIAAGVGAAALRRSGRSDGWVLGLVLLVAAIGVGSFLFHVFANGWSHLADVGPITLFIYAYLAFALRRFLGLAWPTTIGLLALFFLSSWLLDPLIRSIIVGPSRYVPALAALALTGGALLIRRHPAAPFVLSASGVFLVSLTFRTIDLPLCDAWPIGTHFVWHILNATTLGILLLAPFTRRSQSIAEDRSPLPTA